jgi:methionine synthase II (cobalamin-independent)
MTFKGLATGIGSMPHKDVDRALDLIFKYTPKIPFWPQLPKRDLRESMMIQFAQNLPCIKVTNDGLLFDPRQSEKELEAFYSRIISQDVDYFRIGKEFASGLYRFYERLKRDGASGIEFIKCQIVGPFTFAAAINDDKGIALMHDEIFMQAILKGLQMKALWQIKLFKEFGKKLILFLDEPYLGSFGSAFTPINRETITKVLGEFTEAIKSEDVLLGVHCCGNADWSIFTEVKNIDIISFDAFGFLDKIILYSADLEKFFKRGGCLCWGIVPTQEFTDKIKTDLLTKRIESGIDKMVRKGIDNDLLVNNLLVSPSCGLATIDIVKSEQILRILNEVSEALRS